MTVAVGADVGARAVRVASAAELELAVERAAGAAHVGIALHTTGPDPFLDRIRLLEIAVPERVYQVDLAEVPYALELGGLRALLGAERPIKVVHDAKRAARFLEEIGVPLGRVFDPKIVGSILSGGRALGDARELSLGALADRYLGAAVPPCPPVLAWAAAGAPPYETTARAAAALLPLRERMVDDVLAEGLLDVAKIEMDCLPAVARMEHAGLPVDVDRWEPVIRMTEEGAAESERHLRRELAARGVARTGNLRGGADLVTALREAGVRVESSRAADLEPLAEDPLVRRALEFKRFANYADSFGRSILAKVHPVTGRLHGDFKQMGTVTGRIQSCAPAVQGFPSAPEYRECVRARGSRVFVVADCSQMELRILAELSGDPVMRAAFASGRDLHCAMAARMYGVDEANVTPEQRKSAKAVNFLVAYGGGPKALAAKLRTDEGAARRIIDQYYRAVPHVDRYLRDCGREAASTGRYRNATGRLMVYAEAPPSTSAESARVERQGKNAPMQSTNADALKCALVEVDRALRATGGRIVNAIHDELLVEGPAEHAEQMRRAVEDAMTRAVSRFVPNVPVVVETHTCAWWIKPDEKPLFRRAALEPAR